jgi:hypothetical protein
LFFPVPDRIKTVESKTGVKLTNIASQESSMLYAARVKLFGISETLTLNVFIPAADAYGYRIGLHEAGISLESIAVVLDQAFGPKEEISSDLGLQYKWHNMYGNVYSIMPDREDGGLWLNIAAYDADIREGYTVKNGELVRMEDSDPFSGVNITYTKKDGKIIRKEQRNKPSDTLPVTDAAREAWNKTKAYLTPEEIADIGFILLSTDGMGENVLSMEWASDKEITEVPPMTEYLEDGDSFETSHALPGLHISLDYLDITNPNGTAYTDTNMSKAIQAARADYADSKNEAQ